MGFGLVRNLFLSALVIAIVCIPLMMWWIANPRTIKEFVDRDVEIVITATPQKSCPYRADFRGGLVLDNNVHVRSHPSKSATKVDILKIGEVIELYSSIPNIESDGWVWVRHTRGWSAAESIDRKTRLIERLLPDIRFDKHPVAENQVTWLHPFGDTVQSRERRRLGDNKTYAYSNGKHGGIDYGVSSNHVRVYAGVKAGKVIYVDATGVRVYTYPYTVIYEHLTGVNTELKEGHLVVPDTFLGYVDYTDPSNAHLHLEVRRDRLIINPTSLLPAIDWCKIKWIEYPADAVYTDPRVQAPIQRVG